MLVLCDTNGGSLPWEIEAITREVREAFPAALLGIHAHNDGGLAEANSLAAIRAGATHLQGTMNGYGERCGNANLCTLIANLELKMGMQTLPPGNLVRLTHIARAVASAANQNLYRQAPYVGQSAFAHKGGIHAAAMRRNPLSYQHIDPAVVGNEPRILVSELAGKGSLQSKAEAIGIASEKIPNLAEVLDHIKRLEHKGFTFDGADASVELMLYRALPGYQPPFKMLDFMVVVEHREGRGIFAEATIKVRVGDHIFHTAAEGNGPVNALDTALRKALLPTYPALADFDLADYKVHILEGKDGVEAAYDTMFYTAAEVERVVRVAFELARRRRKKVTSVDKANVLESSRLWREVATRVAQDYPDVEFDSMYVDIAAMRLVRYPAVFDVMVTENTFGDILTDEASMIAGSMGMLPSAAIGDHKPGLYEPIHGSAPKYAGQDVANPIATILTGAMLLRYSLGLETEARAIEEAVGAVLAEGYRTKDILEEGARLVGTREMGDRIAAKIEA